MTLVATGPGEAPLREGEACAAVTEAVCRVAEARPPLGWTIAFGVSTILLLAFLVNLGLVAWFGVGLLGTSHPVAWGLPIVNFVFWIGIGHAGTLISAILLLLRQGWRTSINRFAEAMTVIAVVCAAIFPGIHLGRPWLAYWMLPYPNQMGMWPQFRSPLEWDIFAVGTYFVVSLLFWYLGMIPDLATLRDRATGAGRRAVFGLAAMGWRGSSRQWRRHERAYFLLAALATPLVLSVHSVVSFDFAVTQLPGWHSTLFPPYFVTGAVFGGFAMVVTLAVPARQFLGLERLIEIRHLETMNKIVLATSMMVAYSYGMEAFVAWYGGQVHDRFALLNRAFGPYAWAYWTMLLCNVAAPHVFWFRAARTNVWVSLAVGVLVSIGMWLERFVIVCVSLTRDFLPSSWGDFRPTAHDVLMLAGSFGLFFTLFLLFCRYLPTVAMAEVKANRHGALPTGASEA